MHLNDVPLHIALAWVMTRSDEFLFYVQENNRTDLGQLLAEYRSLDSGAISTAPSVENAWLALRQHFVSRSERMEDHVRGDIWGTPYEKGNHITRPGIFGQSFDTEMDVLANPKLIPTEALINLVVIPGDTEIRLRPSAWVVEGGWLWREVEVELSTIVKAFPANTTKAAISSKAEYIAKPRRPSPQHLAIEQAIKELWPNGAADRLQLNNSSMIEVILDWIKKRPNMAGASKITVRRYLEKLLKSDH